MHQENLVNTTIPCTEEQEKKNNQTYAAWVMKKNTKKYFQVITAKGNELINNATFI